jgi:hypothetical protein
LQISYFFHLYDVEEEEVIIIDFLFEIFCHSLRQKKRKNCERKLEKRNRNLNLNNVFGKMRQIFYVKKLKKYI